MMGYWYFWGKGISCCVLKIKTFTCKSLKRFKQEIVAKINLHSPELRDAVKYLKDWVFVYAATFSYCIPSFVKKQVPTIALFVRSERLKILTICQAWYKFYLVSRAIDTLRPILENPITSLKCVDYACSKVSRLQVKSLFSINRYLLTLKKECVDLRLETLSQ